MHNLVGLEPTYGIQGLQYKPFKSLKYKYAFKKALGLTKSYQGSSLHVGLGLNLSFKYR